MLLLEKIGMKRIGLLGCGSIGSQIAIAIDTGKIPAQLTQSQILNAQELALEVFALLRCRSLARVDFFFDERANKWLVNEINTMPGFTPISMYPKLWANSGLSYEELVEVLISTAS